MAMSEFDKGYYARRAAEEAELALAADDQEAADAHRKLQRAYIERASIGDRPEVAAEMIG
jgi:hypothetical protein